MDKAPSRIYNQWHRRGNTPDKSHEAYNISDIHSGRDTLRGIWAAAAVKPPQVASGASGYLSKVTRQQPFFPSQEAAIVPSELEKIVERQGGYKEPEEIADSAPVSSDLIDLSQPAPEPFDQTPALKPEKKQGRPKKVINV